jgi:hypothetical protein
MDAHTLFLGPYPKPLDSALGLAVNFSFLRKIMIGARFMARATLRQESHSKDRLIDFNFGKTRK